MSNFHPLEVVGRGSETQLQVSGNLKKNNFSALRVKLFKLYLLCLVLLQA